MTSPLVTLDAGRLGEIRLVEPAGVTPITPASRITVQAVAARSTLLSGVGIDWGAGTGCVAVAAALVSGVARVIAIDVDVANLASIRTNAALNHVETKVETLHADSFAPLATEGGDRLAALRGSVDFLVGNPPGSLGDDGLGWRRRVLADAKPFLVPGAPAFLQVSAQYGVRRIAKLAEDVGGYRYRGVVASSSWGVFDVERPDLRDLLAGYAAEEERGGLAYAFDPAGLTAAEVVRRLASDRIHPLTRWQVHRFDVLS